ncbi:protein TASOR isoform X2 [Denticeps clupeoides]|uniref:DUF3715 domain-containing protein n=1 Tax=Denticeps clupeoides TaxID=299321 RepID=A0AAY4BLW7_9TELE|nr:protein TASOR isoform X2 [Denticeps clupeoides]
MACRDGRTGARVLAADAIAETVQDGAGPACNPAGCPEMPRSVEESPRLNFHIPRKNKEKRALLQVVSSDSREGVDILNIITSGYMDTSSLGSYVYTKPQVITSELQEKEFIEKRRELKLDGRTEKEMTESYCFLLCESYKLQSICEKGLCVGHSWMNILGNAAKGIYLCKYSDLLQINPFDVGYTGQIIIFKVIKGKMKSISENMGKNLDPTPNFDSHVSKNAARVVSPLTYRAFEHTQHYFYEYSDVDVRPRPRQVCPYAVMSFQFKGKEAAPVPKPMPPLRSNSYSSTKVKKSYTVWSGQLVNQGKTAFHVSFRSHSHPILPFKLPDKIEIGTVMSLDLIKLRVPFTLFSCDVYSGSQEVFKKDAHCCLFEMVDKSNSGLDVLLYKLEQKGLVLVNTLTDQGFLILLSSGQMLNLNEKQEGWKNTKLHALFVFKTSRDVTKNIPKPSGVPELPANHMPLLPWVNAFVPALHYALNKAHCNPTSDLSEGVQSQAREYLKGNHEGQQWPRVRLDYDTSDREHSATRQRVCFNWEGIMRSYIYNPNLYLIPIVKASNMMQDIPVSTSDQSGGKQGEQNPAMVKDLLTLIQMSKRKGEQDLEPTEAHGVKRKLDDEEGAVASKCARVEPVNNPTSMEDGNQTSPSLTEMLNSMGLPDTDLRRDGSQEALKLLQMLETFNRSNPAETEPNLAETSAGRDGNGCAEKILFDSIVKLGLPTNCDLDLRNSDNKEKTDKFEEETAGSMSSLEAFSPCSDSGHQRGANILEEKSIPWVLIPITGLKNDGYCPRHQDMLPQDPRSGPTTGTLTETPQHLQPAIISDSKTAASCRDESTLRDQPVALETEEESQPEQEVDSEQDAPRNLTDELKSSHWKEHCSSLLGSFDTIVDEQLSDFSAGMRELLRAERVYYNALSSPHDSRPPVQTPMRPFSEYVSHFYTPVPLYNYVRTLRSDLTSYIDSHVRSSCSTADSQIPSPRSPLHNTDRLPSRSHSQCPSSQASRPSSRNQKGALELKRPQPAQELSPAARPESLERLNGRAYADSAVGRASPQTDGSKRTEQLSRDSSGLVDCEPLSLSLTSVINQLNPEIITSLSAIIKGVQDNAIHFYVHSEENVISAELKDYLRRLGNSECNPWDYLKKNRMHSDKLLIITRNEDIADRVHTIPGLVTLKKMPSVSFAGVDSLDDIKNHTYNELFVSGGFIVSDDFVLNPDFITQERLQKLLEFLNHVNSPESSWRWKVHCKTLKKLREQSRVRRDALNLLKLLTEHQKKHMVDFLPYHDCDAPTHTTADLECLVKLQAQHTQHRHLIFLTERCLDLFPQHPRSGIVVASINDVLQSFTSLTGFHDVEKNSPLLDNQVSHTSDLKDHPEHTPLGSEDFVSTKGPGSSRFTDQNQVFLPSDSSQPAHADLQELDFEALKSTIFQFKATRTSRMHPPTEADDDGDTPSAFNVDTKQSFLDSGLRVSSSLPQVKAQPSQENRENSTFQTGQEDITTSVNGQLATTNRETQAGGLSDFSDTSCPLQGQTVTSTQQSPVAHFPLRMDSVKSEGKSDDTPQISYTVPEKRGDTTTTPENSTATGTGHKESVSTTSEMESEETPTSACLETHAQNFSTVEAHFGYPWATTPLSFTMRGGNALQSHGLLPAVQGPMDFATQALGPNVSNTTSAMGLQNLMGGVVTHSGLHGFLPNSNVPAAWDHFPQGGDVANMWGVQRARFMHGFTWRTGFSSQGNGFRHFRGAFGGW